VKLSILYENDPRLDAYLDKKVHGHQPTNINHIKSMLVVPKGFTRAVRLVMSAVAEKFGFHSLNDAQAYSVHYGGKKQKSPITISGPRMLGSFGQLGVSWSIKTHPGELYKGSSMELLIAFLQAEAECVLNNKSYPIDNDLADIIVNEVKQTIDYEELMRTQEIAY